MFNTLQLFSLIKHGNLEAHLINDSLNLKEGTDVQNKSFCLSVCLAFYSLFVPFFMSSFPYVFDCGKQSINPFLYPPPHSGLFFEQFWAISKVPMVLIKESIR